MKIAIASDGKEITSTISEKGGRASYYLIFENGVLLEIFKNPFAVGGGGAGPSVAKVLKGKGISKVFGKKFGEKMISALQERKVKFEETTFLTVKEVLETVF